jgi:DnaK suppressor protein
MIRRRILDNIRGQLVMQMEALQGMAGRTALRIKSEAGNLADVIDRASVEQDRVVELTMRDRESQQIKEIRETILRIDRGEFGSCTRCGQTIDQRRLLLAPMSRLCTSCKARLEYRRNRGGRRVSGYGESRYHAA